MLTALFRALLPDAERDEILADLTTEHSLRAARHGRVAARLWLWKQMVGSLPALARRSIWRGRTGFEPRSSYMQPGGFVAESWIMDLRYSARRLAMRPVYTLLAVLTLALGAGGTAAIFSIVRALLLDPLPIAREHEVGILWMPGDWNEHEFLSLRPNWPGFRNMAAIRPLDATLETPGAPLRLVRGVGVSAEAFDVLGRGPMMGRTFRAGEDLPGAERTVVLSYGFWKELGGDPALIGKQLRLGGRARTVIGVMPPDFWFPSPLVRVWTPIQMRQNNRAGNYALFGRIAPEGRIDRMEGPLRALAATMKARFQYPPAWDKTRAPAIIPVRDHLVGKVRIGLLATLAAMALILITACVNVTALMLGQMGSRSTELAVRTALGAGRQRLIQQLVMESLLIGSLAGLSGAAFAAATFRVLVRALPLGALASTARLDWTIFWAATVIALLSAAVIAIIPGLVLWRGGVHRSMSTSRSAGLSLRGGRLEGGLVVVQVALAVVLAAGAGLLIRTVSNLRGINPGVDLDDVAVIHVTMPTQLNNDQLRLAVLDVMPAIEALPGVRSAAATMKLPLRGAGQDWGIGIIGKPDLPSTTTYFRTVTHNYFNTLGIAVERGRGFESADRATSERLVVINEALAAKYFPGEDPVGRRITTGFDERGERIIGVVENVAEAYLTDPAVPARYMLYEHVPLQWHQATFVLKARDADALPAVLDNARRTLERESRLLATEETTTMRTVFDEAIGAARHLAKMLSLLAALAILLGAVGVYGMISQFVTRRMWEYGIRIALGLSPGRLVSQVMSRGVLLVVAGSIAGVTAAFMLTGVLRPLLYGVQPADWRALGGSVLALVAVGSLAAAAPAIRASRTDPAVVLREQ